MMAPCAPAHALPGFKKDLNKRRKAKIPESEFKEGPQGLKYYDVVLGKGAEVKEGVRAVVHYEARWRGITFMTSRFIPLLHFRIYATALPARGWSSTVSPCQSSSQDTWACHLLGDTYMARPLKAWGYASQIKTRGETLCILLRADRAWA